MARKKTRFSLRTQKEEFKFGSVPPTATHTVHVRWNCTSERCGKSSIQKIVSTWLIDEGLSKDCVWCHSPTMIGNQFIVKCKCQKCGQVGQKTLLTGERIYKTIDWKCIKCGSPNRVIIKKR